jgi:hypothetical protein
MRLDGHAEPFRVRAAYLIDGDIVEMAGAYPAPTGDREDQQCAA